MANWSNPTLTSTYTNFVTEVKDRDTDCATLFDGSTSTNLPTGTKRWNATSNKFEKWSGTAWSDLSSGYAITITGNAANITGVAAAANGGTGQSSYAVGDLLYASAATTVSKLADVATGNALLSGGVGAAPFYGKIGLTTHISGTLPVANGGTGQSSYAVGDLLYASAATTVSKLADVATGNALLSGGVGAAPFYGKIGLTTHISGTLPVANGGTGVTTSTGSGSAVLSTSPVFDTSITTPMVLGGSGTTSTLILRATSGAGSTGADILFQVGNNGATEAGRILNNGNFLIGKNTADLAIAGLQMYNDAGAAARINFSKTGSGNYDGIANYHSGTYVGGITYSNTATALATSSDVRLKKNIFDAGPALDKVANIRVVKYDWINDASSVDFGFIAQQLASVYAEPVRQGDAGATIETTWCVDYGRLTPLLVKAIQELRAEIIELKRQMGKP